MENDRLEAIEKKIDIISELVLKMCQVIVSSEYKQEESNK